MLPFEFLKFIFGNNRPLPDTNSRPNLDQNLSPVKPTAYDQSHLDSPNPGANSFFTKKRSYPSKILKSTSQSELIDSKQNQIGTQQNQDSADDQKAIDQNNKNKSTEMNYQKSANPHELPTLRNKANRVNSPRSASPNPKPTPQSLQPDFLQRKTSDPDFKHTKMMLAVETKKMRRNERDNVVEFLIGQARRRIHNLTHKAIEINRKKMVNQGVLDSRKCKERLTAGELRNIIHNLDGMRGRRQGVDRFVERMKIKRSDQVDLKKLRQFLADWGEKMDMKDKRPNFAQNEQKIGKKIYIIKFF